MKARTSKAIVHAFTLLEALIVIALIAILAAMLLPAGRGRGPATLTYCLSNQKQIALGEMIFAEDHAGKYQWETSITNGGTLEISSKSDAAVHFLALSNYINYPKPFVCPTDRARRSATNLPSLSNSNVSYFLNLSATTNSPQDILSGDRHLQMNGRPVTPGVLLVKSNSNATWTSELHKMKSAQRGAVSFGDGHVESLRDGLAPYFSRTNTVAMQLVIP